MPERKCLLISYYFPPLGGAGIGRPLALFRELPKVDYDCHVLTVKPVSYRVYEPELLDGLDLRKIYRAGSHDPQRLLYLLGVRRIKGRAIDKGRAGSDRFFPDPKIGWVRKAVKLGRTLIANRKYDIIMSTSPPISAHLVARQLSREFDIPWVADFRDYWTAFKPEDWYRDQRMIDRSRELLTTINREASAVTAVNDSIASYLDADSVVTNSYSEELADLWTEPDRSHFKIALYGTFNELYPIRPLLELLNRLRDTKPECFERVRLVQVGDVDQSWLATNLEQIDMSAICSQNGHLPRAEAIKKISGCTMAYLSLPFENERGASTGRIYDLLASGRPIIAAVPNDSEVAKLIQLTGNGFCFGDDTISDASSYLSAKIDSFDRGELCIEPRPDYAERFSSRSMVKQFAEIFNRVIAGESSSS